MARKIYDRTIYHSRLNQLERKVYDRTNNVLPYEPVPPAAISYEVTNVAVTTPGTGYEANDVLSIPGSGSDTQATVTVQSVDEGGVITEVVVTTPGSYSENLSGEIEPTGGTGTGASLNVTMALKE